MAVGPIAFGRIPNQLAFERMLGTLATQQREMLRVQDQLATGLRLSIPSDEPVTALQAISLQRLLERKAQVQKNLASAQSYLGATDSALVNVGDRLREARGLALANIGDSSTEAERQAAVKQVEGIIDQLLMVANGQFRDRRLFSGARLDDNPYAYVDGFIRYAGDTGDLLTFADLDALLATNLSGHQVFGGISKAVSGSADLNPAVTATTRLADLRGGLGVTRGQIEVSDGSTKTLVDLSQAETIGDVIALIEDQGPAGISVAINGTANGLQITLGGGTLTVREVGLGKTAAHLGILAATPVGLTLTGSDVDPRLTLTTSLADLLAGAGFDQTSGLTITNGGQTQTIDFTTDLTVEGLLNRLNGAGLGLHAGINEAGTGLQVSTILSGAAFTIGENGGSTATDLGLRSFDQQSLLTSLNFGRGVPIATGDDLIITRKDGVVLNIDLDGASSVADVISRINSHPDNTGGNLVAGLTAVGNGIELVDTTGGTGSLSATGRSAGGLGLQMTIPDPGATLTGSDVNPQEASGMFTSLLRLRDALEAGDDSEIERATSSLAVDLENLALAQGDVGARLRAADNRAAQLSGEEIELRGLLSDQIDTDLAEAISNLQLRQAAFEAALVAASVSLQSNLLDFL